MRFIVVDGLDGSGKDTQAHLIKKRYESWGETVLIRSHPERDNYYGKEAKKALLGKGKLNHFKASIFYALDVIYSIRKFYKKRGIGTFIIVRYLIGVAYLPFFLARILYKIFSTFLPMSPYMFFLDVPPQESLRRLTNRSEREMFENLQELRHVRHKALQLVQEWHIIDGNHSIQQTYDQIASILNSLDTQDIKSPTTLSHEKR